MLGEALIDVETAQRAIDGSPFGRWWGYRVEELGPGRARLLLPFQPHFERPGGVLQGGCAMTLADVAFWIAGMTVMGEDPTALTLQMSSSFLRPAFLGDLRSEAKHPPRGPTHPLRRGVGHGHEGEPPDAPRAHVHAAGRVPAVTEGRESGNAAETRRSRRPTAADAAAAFSTGGRRRPGRRRRPRCRPCSSNRRSLHRASGAACCPRQGSLHRVGPAFHRLR